MIKNLNKKTALQETPNTNNYWNAMNYLASPYFNAQTMIGTLPIQHYVSSALENHIKGDRIKSSTSKPLHINFL